MNEISPRLKLALEFIRESKYERSDAAVARAVGVTYSNLCMCKMGKRKPTWDILIKLCDLYPINFEWLRTGDGVMVNRREHELRKKIAELEGMIRELERGR